MGAIADSTASLVTLGIIFVLLIPAIYVMQSAANAAERRFKDGDDTVFPARAAAARRRREAKKRDSS